MAAFIKSLLYRKQVRTLYSSEILPHFPRYAKFGQLVPVWCATPEIGRVIHRFFDTSPFSPSGRYLALTRFPFEDHLPNPGDIAEIILVDLEAGGSPLVVANTRGWDTQLGAQVQWGTDDNQLFFNDVDVKTWQAYGVKMDFSSGTTTKLDGPVYMVSPDGNWAASPCLLRIGVTQKGYGVIVPPERIPLNHGASTKDGIFITNTSTGECRLIVSLYEIVERMSPLFSGDEFKDGDFYGFHIKWNPLGTRLLFVLRWVSHDKCIKRKNCLITMKVDGSDLQLAIPAEEWAKGGHHPNWCPDGQNIIMNLNIHGDGLRFVTVKYDGTNYGPLLDSVIGSGHPTLHPDGRYIVTDAYPSEPVASGNGTTPIRLIDLKTEQEQTLAQVNVTPSFRGPNGELRVDPHPAWDYDFRRIAFNGFSNGTRRVYIADLSNVIE